MFADDYDIKGNAIGFTTSFTLHVLVFLLIFMHNYKQKRELADYTLTEITMIQEVPDEQKPVPIQKPKKLMDIFKQVIPIKQKPQVELAKPKLELEKPKLTLEKPKALTLDKLDKPKLDPAMKKIDLSNEIGQKKLSAAQVKKIELAQKEQPKLASAPNKVSLAKQSKPSFLPQARPGISTISKKNVLVKPQTVKIDKPTPVAQVAQKENIVISKKNALMITGQIANRQVLSAKKPYYPRWAQEQGIEAEVSIAITVRPDGSVKENARIAFTSGHSELDDLALEAVLQFKFAPKPISADETGVVIFRYMLER